MQPDKITLFKEDLIQSKLTSEQVFQKYIVDGHSYYFSEVLKDINKEYEIKSLIADYLNVHIHEIIIVGSGKMGFSLNPKNLFNPFDHKFNQTRQNLDKSDIDVAIVSKPFFENIGDDLFDFTDSFKQRWVTNEYYNTQKAAEFPVPLPYKYFEYYTKGWFRPDFKPTGFEVCVNGAYEELKRKFQNITGRKLALGIYKNWYYFKNYQIDNIDNLRKKKITTIL